MRRLSALLIAPFVVAACAGSDDADTVAVSDTAVVEPLATDPTDTTEAPVTDPPSTDAATTEPAVTDPPSTDAATTEPVTTDAPTTEPPASDPATSGAAFAPGDVGEYEVGVSTITITDVTRDRPLTVDVWFPLMPDVDADLHRYTFVTGDYYESPRAVSAGPDSISPDGPFPLVVYSHGSGGQRYIHSDYTETIASHGYVVAAADHTGNTAIERVAEIEIDRAEVALNRPLDVIAVIDSMLNPESAETAGFVGSVDPERIAVTGHSFGGFTAYAVVSGYANDLGTSPPDDRVDAIIPLAPAVTDGGENPLLTNERLAAVDVPQLVMVGTDDVTTPVDPNVTTAVEFSTSDPLYRVELEDAEHQSFTDVCDYLESFPQLDPPASEAVIGAIEAVASEGCSEDDMAIDRVQEITNAFAVAFLDARFGDGEMITSEIPDDVTFQQVR